MAASRKPPCQSAWPGLALDLLGDVLSRLPSLVDRIRIRFRAVCRPWRRGSKLMPPAPPQLPWFVLLGGIVLDIANKKMHRLRIPKGGHYSAGENMFFLRQNGWRCSVVNGFSGAATPLPELAALLKSYMADPLDDKLERKQYLNTKKIKKVVISSSPNHQPLVAVLVVSDCGKSKVFISTCRPAGEINSCVVTREISAILDIVFFQGKLYAHLSMYEELLAIDLSNGCLDDTPTTPSEEKPYTSWISPPNLPDVYNQDLFDNFEHARVHRRGEILERYLVESNGKLLLVRRRGRTDCGHLTCRFDMFEADLSGGPRLGRWKKVDSLDGWALFVSTTCSKSVRAAHGDGHGPRGDCIHFVLNDGNPILNSGVYSVVDKTTMPLIVIRPVSAFRRAKLSWAWGSQRFPAWFFPVEV